MARELPAKDLARQQLSLGEPPRSFLPLLADRLKYRLVPVTLKSSLREKNGPATVDRVEVRIFIAAAFLAGSISNASAQGIPASSTWKNQRGSILEITSVDSSTGVITGKFTNNAPNTLCIGTPYDIVGHTLKNGGVFFGSHSHHPATPSLHGGGQSLERASRRLWALSVIDDESGAIETVSGADTFTQQ
jgi:hypothetical protein